MKTFPLMCRISNDAGVTRVDVYDDIGEGGWFSEGLTAKDFTAQLAKVKGALEVHINSGGGDVFDGISISNAIRNHKGPVTTVVDGLAASIASVIAQAGSPRVVQPGSMLMIHDAFGMCVGDAAEMTSMASTLDKVSDNIAGIYAANSDKSAAEWRASMRDETWYTAEEAVAAGLADQVGDQQAELPAGLDLAAFTAVPGRIAARLRAMPQAAAAAVPEPDGDGDGDGKTCPTCKGTGKIMQGHRACPDCDGTGKVAADGDGDGATPDGDGAADRAAIVIRDAAGLRVLGIESMPIADKALPVHHTATVDTPWDGPGAVAAMPNDDTVLEYCHAWQDSDAASVPHREGDDDADDQKSNYKFPHHTGKGAPANLPACRNGLARLSGASIPDGDRAGVKAHLQAHLDDAPGGGSSDQSHEDISGISPDDIRAALRGAFA
jgi:ATP-dependent protease ClpP protease subunit